jgi:hypothetical protein
MPEHNINYQCVCQWSDHDGERGSEKRAVGASRREGRRQSRVLVSAFLCSPLCLGVLVVNAF